MRKYQYIQQADLRTSSQGVCRSSFCISAHVCIASVMLHQCTCGGNNFGRVCLLVGWVILVDGRAQSCSNVHVPVDDSLGVVSSKGPHIRHCTLQSLSFRACLMFVLLYAMCASHASTHALTHAASMATISVVRLSVCLMGASFIIADFHSQLQLSHLQHMNM